MSNGFVDELTRFAEELANQSGAMLRAAIQTAPAVELKSDRSYVTATDKAIETRLREMIDSRYPDHGILGEEHGARDLDAEFVWVLDPIDGTAPFIAGIPVYGTLIGLARNGRPWVGVIDHPASADRWVGVSGDRASHNGRPVRTRACACLAAALMTNSNPDFFSSGDRARFDRLRAQVTYTQYGGSCFAYGVMASGRTDLAADGGLDPFDIFAPAAVIEGAGGIVTDWSGTAIDLSWTGLVLAAGDHRIHNEALTCLVAP